MINRIQNSSATRAPQPVEDIESFDDINQIALNPIELVGNTARMVLPASLLIGTGTQNLPGVNSMYLYQGTSNILSNGTRGVFIGFTNGTVATINMQGKVEIGQSIREYLPFIPATTHFGGFVNLRVDLAEAFGMATELLAQLGYTKDQFLNSDGSIRDDVDFATLGRVIGHMSGAITPALLNVKDGGNIRLTVGVYLTPESVIRLMGPKGVAVAAKMEAFRTKTGFYPKVAASSNVQLIRDSSDPSGWKVEVNGVRVPGREFFEHFTNDRVIESIDPDEMAAAIEEILPTLNHGNPQIANFSNNYWMQEGHANPYELAATSNGLNHGDPVLAEANKIRAAVHDYGHMVLSQLPPGAQHIVANGVTSSSHLWVIAAIYERLPADQKGRFLERLKNEFHMNFGIQELRDLNWATYGGTFHEDHDRVRELLLSSGIPDILIAGDLDDLDLNYLDLNGGMPGFNAEDQELLDPDMQAAWDLVTEAAVEITGNVAEAMSAQPRSYDPIAQKIDEAMAFVGPLLPETARNVIRTASAGLRVADGDSTFDQKAALAMAALNALPLGENVDAALDYAALGMQLRQFFINPSIGGGASLAANLIGRGVGPKTAATIGTVANAIELAFAPTPQNFAKFAWSAVNLTQMYDQVRIDMGETSVAGGATADVTFMGHTNSRGPEYRYVLSGDEPNLPALNRAIFDLVGQDDGSFIFTGKGFRDPLSIDSDVLGEMVTPGLVPRLGSELLSRRQPDRVHDNFRVDSGLAQLLMQHNGGNTHFDVNANWSAFSHVDDLFARFALDTTYFQPAKEGMLSEYDLGDPLAVRTFPGLPQVQGYDDRIVAAFRQPGMMNHRFTFRDIESAALFQANGFEIVSLIASDPDLIQTFGLNGDVQGMLDFVLANADRPVPADIFSAFAYAAANPDLRSHFDERDMMGYALHYLTAGHREGRPVHADPAATSRELDRYLAFSVFDENLYRALYPDVAAAIDAGGFADAREHFRAFGMDEGRLPTFNEQAYLEANPDVAEAVASGAIDSALGHYSRHGQFEGRALAPANIAPPEPVQSAETPAAVGFDERAYLAANPDVAAAIANGTMDSARGHWERHGQSEGRAFFDEQGYLARHQGVAEAVANGTMDSALGHWERHGQHEGFGIAVRQDAPIAPAAEAPPPAPTPAPAPAPSFEEAYFAANPDVAASGMSAEEHYQAHGAAEGRTW